MKKIFSLILSLLMVLFCGILVFSACKSNNLKTIFFDSNGGNEIYKMNAVAGAEITLPSIERKNYVFVGWEDEDGNIYFSNYVMPDSDVVLTAKWTVLETNGYGIVIGLQENVSAITAIDIPDKIKDEEIIAIGNNAFQNQSNLKIVSIPKTINKIGNEAFSGCALLEKVNIEENSNLYIISEKAFYNCEMLEDIEIPDSVLEIGQSAFEGCTSLKSVKLSYKMDNITASLFKDCVSLETISIPPNVTYIYENAFYNCVGLKNLILKENFTLYHIEKDAFYNVKNLEVLDIGNLKQWCRVYFENAYSVPVGEYVSLYLNGILTEELVIDETIKYINPYSLKNVDNLKKITVSGKNASYKSDNNCIIKKDDNSLVFYMDDAVIPSYVTNIEKGVLDYTNLKRIVVPSTVTSIEFGAFEKCEHLTEITLHFVGNDVENSKSGIFGYIFGAKYYTNNSSYVPESLLTVNITGGGNIQENAFYDCRNIQILDFKATCTFTEIGDRAFKQMSKIKKLILPATLRKIGLEICQYSNLFGAVYDGCICFRGTKEQWNQIYDSKNSAENPKIDAYANSYVCKSRKYFNYKD